MIAVISTEMLKFIKSKMIWVTIIVSILIAGLSMVINNRGKGLYDYSFYEMFLAAIFGIMIFSMYAAFIFTVEYSEATINTLFTTPISRIKILTGKLVTIFLVIFLTVLLSTVLTTAFTGIIKGKSILYKGKGIWGSVSFSLLTALISSLLQFMLIPFIAFISMWRKNIVPCIVFTILVCAIDIVFVDNIFDNTIGLTFFFPWSSPLVGIMHWYGAKFTHGITSSMISLIAIFFIGIIACVGYCQKSDVYLVK